MRTLILGGARSGKSRHAESLARTSGKEVVYIATAEARDAEMQGRIAHHRTSRPDSWMTVETPTALGEAVQQHAIFGQFVLVDCLTLWLSNLILSAGDPAPEVGILALPELFHVERANLIDALGNATGDVVLVSNEVGLGVVPYGAVSRCFVDEAGRLNQEIAALCDRVVLVTAGLPLVLKG